MRGERWKSGLVWLGLVVAVSGAVAAEGWDRTDAPPGHDASDCGACRAHQTTRGPTLPYELGADNIRFTYPVALTGGGEDRQ